MEPEKYRLLDSWIFSLFTYLERFIIGKKECIKNISSLLHQLTYSYYDENYFYETLNKLKEGIKELNNIRTTEYGKKLLEYFIEEIYDLERKYRICPREPYQLFRYDIVVVLSVSRHPELSNLFIVKGKGKRTYIIVTNIKSIKVGEKRPVVLLPPKEFGSIISEAMFITEYPINSLNDIKIEDLRKLNRYYFEILQKSK